MTPRQQAVIEYLQEEVRVLQGQLSERHRFTDDKRRKLAVKGKSVGQKALLQFANLNVYAERFVCTIKESF